VFNRLNGLCWFLVGVTTENIAALYYIVGPDAPTGRETGCWTWNIFGCRCATVGHLRTPNDINTCY